METHGGKPLSQKVKTVEPLLLMHTAPIRGKARDIEWLIMYTYLNKKLRGEDNKNKKSIEKPWVYHLNK